MIQIQHENSFCKDSDIVCLVLGFIPSLVELTVCRTSRYKCDTGFCASLLVSVCVFVSDIIHFIFEQEVDSVVTTLGS